MTERLLLVISVVIVMFVIIKYLKYQQLKKVKNFSHELIKDKEKTLQIIYFWSPQCRQCLNMQKPVLENISQNFSVSIVNINIAEEADFVKQWDVRTVPSTYLLNCLGEIEFINNGFKSEKEILAQLESL